MTDDIVARLRVFAKFDPDQAEAADEIERLRAALFQIAHQKYGSQMSCVDNYNALQTAARAALGEASDDAAT